MFLQINILEGRAGCVILMGRVSVTFSYLFSCLTTETVQYINVNSFIENLAASKKQYVGTERETNAIKNYIGYIHLDVQKKWV